MIPESGFLRALVPHIAQDPAIGLVACPMAYYDLPSTLNGPTASLLDLTGTLTRPSDRKLNGIRSGILLRRSAVLELGGFPTYSCIDDGAIVTLLATKGYQSVIVKDSAQCGTAPVDFVSSTSHASALRIGWLKAASSHRRLGARFWGSVLPMGRLIFSLLICCCIISIPIQFFSATVLVPVLEISKLAGLVQMSFLMLFVFGLRDVLWCTRSSRLRSDVSYTFHSPLAMYDSSLMIWLTVVQVRQPLGVAYRSGLLWHLTTCFSSWRDAIHSHPRIVSLPLGSIPRDLVFIDFGVPLFKDKLGFTSVSRWVS